MDHDSPQARALQALETLQNLDLEVLSLPYQAAFEVGRKLRCISQRKKKPRLKKANKSTDSLHIAQPDLRHAKNARIVKRKNLTNGDSATLAPEPRPPQPSTVVHLVGALNNARTAIIRDLTDPAIEAAVTTPPEYVGQDARYLDLKSSRRTPVSRGKRLLARRWVATCYEQWLQDAYQRSRVSELVNDPKSKSKSGNFEEFFNSDRCQLGKTSIASNGLWEGLKLLVLEQLCGWDAVSAIVNYQSACLKDSSMSELKPMSLAIKNSEWIMEFVKSRPDWLASCQTRYNACYGTSSQLVIQYTSSVSKVALSQPLSTASASQELEGLGVCPNASAQGSGDDTGTLHHSQDVVIEAHDHNVPDSTYNELPHPQPLSHDGSTFDARAYSDPDVLYAANMMPDLQTVGQDVHNECGLQSAPFIQLSYSSYNWDKFDPNVYLDIPHHSMDMMSGVIFAG